MVRDKSQRTEKPEQQSLAKKSCHRNSSQNTVCFVQLTLKCLNRAALSLSRSKKASAELYHISVASEEIFVVINQPIMEDTR